MASPHVGHSRLPKDVSSLFIITVIGGALIAINGFLNAIIAGSADIYTIIFPFLSPSQIHILVGIGATIGGLVIAFGALTILLSPSMYRAAKRHRMAVSIGAITLASIGLVSGGGFVIGFVLVIISSVWFITMGTIRASAIGNRSRDTKKYKLVNIANLNERESRIYHILGDNGGNMLQSVLVDKSGMSKVQVTRVLDKLETKDIVERRRMGMSNLVMLKRS